MSEGTPRTADDELLVAYLDSELSETLRGDLESRLADEPPLRQRLAELQRSWDALDTLPRVTEDPVLTASTISMAARQANDPAMSEDRRARGSVIGPWLWTFALILGAGSLGFASLAIPRTLARRSHLRDLPVVQAMDMYRYAGSLAFLRALADDPRLSFVTDPHPTESPSADASMTQVVSLSDIKLSLVKLPADDQLELRNRQQRFQQLTETERDHLRAFHRQLQQSPDRDRLYQVLIRHYDWLGTLGALERAELLELPDRPRLAAMRNKGMQPPPVRPPLRVMDLPVSDRIAIRSFFDAYLRRHQEELVALLPERQRLEIEDAIREGLRPPLYLRRMFVQHIHRSQWPRPTEAEIGLLLTALSPRVANELSRRIDARGSLEMLTMAAEIGARARTRPFRVDPRRIDEIIKSLPPADRERLSKLPHEDLQIELRRQYSERNRGQDRPVRPAGPLYDLPTPPPQTSD